MLKFKYDGSNLRRALATCDVESVHFYEVSNHNSYCMKAESALNYYRAFASEGTKIKIRAYAVEVVFYGIDDETRKIPESIITIYFK